MVVSIDVVGVAVMRDHDTGAVLKHTLKRDEREGVLVFPNALECEEYQRQVVEMDLQTGAEGYLGDTDLMPLADVLADAMDGDYPVWEARHVGEVWHFVTLINRVSHPALV